MEGQWFQDRASGEYYRYSSAEGCYIYQTGRKVYVSARAGAQTQPAEQNLPRTIPRAGQTGRQDYVAQQNVGYQSGVSGQNYTTNASVQSAANPSTDNAAVPQYILSGHGRVDSRPTARPPTATGLETGLRALDLSSSPATQGSYAHYADYANRSQAGTKVLAGYDEASGVQSYVEIGNPQQLTDPALYNVGIRAGKKLKETPGNEERLDKAYKKRDKPKRFFVHGKVFKCLWVEPAGDDSDNVTVVTDGTFGAVRTHAKIRRFVVVREAHDSCTALPILTYSGQGVAKRGVKKSDHAIIYTGRIAPEPVQTERPQRGEAGMRPGSIRVDPDEPHIRLDPMSRICFGKVYTIEHNVKVQSIGMVNRAYMQSLLYNFRDVWVNTAGPGLAQSQASPAAAGPSRSTATMSRPAGARARVEENSEGDDTDDEDDDEDEEDDEDGDDDGDKEEEEDDEDDD